MTDTESGRDATGLVSLSALELLAGYAAGDFSPVEVCAATLDRLERLEPVLNAFYVIEAEQARESAAASARRWA